MTEKTISANLSVLSNKITKLSPSEVAGCDKLIVETKNLIGTLSPSKRSVYITRLTDYEDKILRYKLCGSLDVPSSSSDMDNVDNGEHGINMLRNSLALLEDSQRIAGETNEELLRQRKIIEGAKNKITTVDENIAESNRLLNKMSTFWRKITS